MYDLSKCKVIYFPFANARSFIILLSFCIGKYTVKVRYYASHAQTLSGGTTILLHVSVGPFLFESVFIKASKEKIRTGKQTSKYCMRVHGMFMCIIA